VWIYELGKSTNPALTTVSRFTLILLKGRLHMASIHEQIKDEVITDLCQSFGYTLEQVEAGDIEIEENYKIHMSKDVRVQYLVDKVIDDMWSQYNHTLEEFVVPHAE